MTEVKTMALIIKTEFKNSQDLLNQKVEYLEQRINKIELNQLKHSDNETDNKILIFPDILVITFACVKSNGYICSVI